MAQTEMAVFDAEEKPTETLIGKYQKFPYFIEVLVQQNMDFYSSKGYFT